MLTAIRFSAVKPQLSAQSALLPITRALPGEQTESFFPPKMLVELNQLDEQAHQRKFGLIKGVLTGQIFEKKLLPSDEKLMALLDHVTKQAYTAEFESFTFEHNDPGFNTRKKNKTYNIVGPNLVKLGGKTYRFHQYMVGGELLDTKYFELRSSDGSKIIKLRYGFNEGGLLTYEDKDTGIVLSKTSRTLRRKAKSMFQAFLDRRKKLMIAANVANTNVLTNQTELKIKNMDKLNF